MPFTVFLTTSAHPSLISSSTYHHLAIFLLSPSKIFQGVFGRRRRGIKIFLPPPHYKADICSLPFMVSSSTTLVADTSGLVYIFHVCFVVCLGLSCTIVFSAFFFIFFYATSFLSYPQLYFSSYMYGFSPQFLPLIHNFQYFHTLVQSNLTFFSV